MMKSKKRLIISIVLALILVFGLATTALALVNPDSYYNARSWTWYYSAPATYSYNCLGYALGTYGNDWPSPFQYPSIQEVDNYLDDFGYYRVTSNADILGYAPNTTTITHYSKVTGTSWCRAKWGSLERFNHASHNPYYSSSAYGLLRLKWRD